MKNPRTAWIVYTSLRLLFFAIPFALLYFLGLWPWLAAVFAALIGVSLSIIFLSRPRATASESIYDWRNRDRTADDIVEDEAVDGAAGEAADRDIPASDGANRGNATANSASTDPTATNITAETSDITTETSDISAETSDISAETLDAGRPTDTDRG